MNPHLMALVLQAGLDRLDQRYRYGDLTELRTVLEGMRDEAILLAVETPAAVEDRFMELVLKQRDEAEPGWRAVPDTAVGDHG